MSTLPQPKVRRPLDSCIDVSSCVAVDAKCEIACRTAVQRLPAMDCTLLESDDAVHSQAITHLVIGQTGRRTIKALLAACSGAHLLQPAWVSESLAAGQWLDTHQYCAQVLLPCLSAGHL